MGNELTIFQTELQEKFELQLKDKGLSKMTYSMKKKDKILVSYNKATLEQLAMDLGLRKEYNDKSLATGKGVLFVAELRLLDNNDRLIASAIGYANTEESSYFKTGGGEQDTLRLGAMAQKRALGFALTPLLVRYGLDYETQARNQGVTLKDNMEYVTTSNVEDMKQEQGIPANDVIDTERVEKLYAVMAQPTEKAIKIFNEFAGIMKTFHNVELEDVIDLNRAVISLLTNKQFELLKKEMGKK